MGIPKGIKPLLPIYIEKSNMNIWKAAWELCRQAVAEFWESDSSWWGSLLTSGQDEQDEMEVCWLQSRQDLERQEDSVLFLVLSSNAK